MAEVVTVTNTAGKIEKNDTKEKRQAKVKLKATAAHPYIKEGTIYEVHPVHEKDLRAKLWAVGEKESLPGTKEMKDAAIPAKHSEEDAAGTGKEPTSGK